MVRSDALAAPAQAGRGGKRLSPRARARLAGLFQALAALMSVVGHQIVLTRLVVDGDAAATARNIEAQEALFRLGFACSVAAVAFQLAWAYLLYQLLRPVNRAVAAFSTVVIVVGCGVQTVAAILYAAPLTILPGPHPLSGLSADEAQGLALAFLNLYYDAYNTYLVFFGFWCILTGYLIARSTFMPRLIGLLLMIDGVGWSLFLWPPLAVFLFPAIAVASGLAQIPLQLWLLVFGVNSTRWDEQARRGRASARSSAADGR